MLNCILATGGAGYIGSHVVAELMDAGYRVVILDNFENADRSVIDRLETITNQMVNLVEGDVRHQPTVERVLRAYQVDVVLHFAGKKAVGESVADPLLYFNDNLNGALSLLGAMRATSVNRLVFSSSATVYGADATLPITETAATVATNPYGRTKLMIEEIIDDCTVAWPEFSAISLRYFNPVGAHSSGLIGEDPQGIPNNLFPYVVRTATGELGEVNVFGGDYSTPDGTGIRDYIHVVDLAKGHLAAARALRGNNDALDRHQRINLGTGNGYSVLDVVSAIATASARKVPYKIVDRRPGDAAASVADATLAKTLLGWEAQRDLAQMCKDQWMFVASRQFALALPAYERVADELTRQRHARVAR